MVEIKSSQIASKVPAGRPEGHRGMSGLMGPKVKPKDSRKTMIRLWRYLRREKKALIGVFIMLTISSVLNLAGPLLIGRAIDEYIIPGNLRGLLRIIGFMAVVYIAGALTTWLQNFVMAGAAQRTVRELRKDLFAKMHTLSLRFYDKYPHGELMSRLTNDIENINITLNQSTIQIFSSLITVTGALIMMLLLSPLLTLLSLATIPLGVFITSKIAVKTRKYFQEQQKTLGELNGFIEESVSGQRVIKVFGRETITIDNFGKINNHLKNVGIRAQIFSGTVGPLMNVVNNLSFALIAGAGGWMTIQGITSIGIIASFLNYSKQFARPINEIANQYNVIQAALAGGERVFEIMDERPEFEDEKEAVILNAIKGEVQFDNVTFGYDKEIPVLKNVNLKAMPGQIIALVGPTGAGKTTIVNLLTRFYDVDQGSICIDGKDIQRIQKDSLRQLVGIVLQDTYLFSDTVRENIRYGRLDATNEEVEAAARFANADLFIQRLPNGYDTILTEEGSNLSQGQRQLLAIARAVLADPAILVLDEATSSIDTRTEMHIQEAMLSLMKGRTSFVIAHRLSTIRDADMILVINDGKIIEQGTHRQLLGQKGFYHSLYTSQFKRQAS